MNDPAHSVTSTSEPASPQPDDRITLCEDLIEPLTGVHGQACILLVTVVATGSTVAGVAQDLWGATAAGWAPWVVLVVLLLSAAGSVGSFAEAAHPGPLAPTGYRVPRHEVVLVRTALIAARVVFATVMIAVWSLTLARLTMWLLGLFA